jgi:hypothetical protein
LLPKTAPSQLTGSAVSLIEITKISDRVNEIDKNFQGRALHLVASFYDFILLLLRIVGESM